MYPTQRGGGATPSRVTPCGYWSTPAQAAAAPSPPAPRAHSAHLGVEAVGFADLMLVGGTDHANGSSRGAAFQPHTDSIGRGDHCQNPKNPLELPVRATAPISTALIAWVWLPDRLNGSRVGGLVLGAAGVYLLVRGKIGVTFGDTHVAILAALLASFFYGLACNFTKRYAQHVKPLAIAAGSQLATTVVLFPVAALSWPTEPVSLRVWIAVVFMGVFSTGFADILYFRLIANAGPTNAITVTYLIPVFAMALGAAVIDEVVTPTMIVGCVVILLGTALANGMLKLPLARQ